MCGCSMIRRLIRLSNAHQLFAKWRLQRSHAQAVIDLDPRARPATIRSAALGIRKRFYIYTPPGYNRTRHRFPVLYLFRGHEHEWINSQQDGARAGRTVLDVYEELLERGAVGPLIIVFPGISSDDNSLSGLLVNYKYPELATKPGLGRAQFEDYFLRELMPYIDRRFRTIPDARAVDGFSLGGFMAIKIAAQYPELFRSAGGYDGLFFWDDPADPHTSAESDITFRNPMFDPAFGPGEGRDRQYAAANNPLNLVRNNHADRLKRVTWLIEYGPEASEPHDSNFYRGDRLCRLLAEKGISNQGRGELKNGSHTWWWADEHIGHVLPLHWHALRHNN